MRTRCEIAGTLFAALLTTLAAPRAPLSGESVVNAEEGGPIRGLVKNPDGSPAREGYVYLIRAGEALRLVNGEVPELSTTSGIRKLEPATRVAISRDGSFSLPPAGGAFLLVAAGDTGFISVNRLEFRPDKPLRLRAWSRITGSVKVDGTPVADITIAVDPSYGRAATGADDEPRLEHGLSTKTDEDGRFELTRVIPGRFEIGQLVPNGLRRRWYFVSLATVDVEERTVVRPENRRERASRHRAARGPRIGSVAGPGGVDQDPGVDGATARGRRARLPGRPLPRRGPRGGRPRAPHRRP